MLHKTKIYAFIFILILFTLACGISDVNPGDPRVREATFEEIEEVLNWLVDIGFLQDTFSIPQINDPVTPADPSDSYTVKGWGPSEPAGTEAIKTTMYLVNLLYQGDCTHQSFSIDREKGYLGTYEIQPGNKDWEMPGVKLEPGMIIAAYAQKSDGSQGLLSNFVLIGKEYFQVNLIQDPMVSEDLLLKDLVGIGPPGHCVEIWHNGTQVGQAEISQEPNDQGQYTWNFTDIPLILGQNNLEFRLKGFDYIKSEYAFTLPEIRISWPLNNGTADTIGTVNAFYGLNNYHKPNYSFHYGIDFEGATGDDVLAVADGIVRWINTDPNTSGGKTIAIAHDDLWVSYYLHLDQINVSLDQKVSRGEKIGEVGETGTWIDGDHLHLEVHMLTEAVNESLVNKTYPQSLSDVNINPYSPAPTTPVLFYNGEDSIFYCCYNPSDYWGIDWTKVKLGYDMDGVYFTESYCTSNQNLCE